MAPVSGAFANSWLPTLGTPAATFRAASTLEFPDLLVDTFRTPHDASEPIGVVVTSQSTGARAAILTGLGYASKTVRRMVRDVDILVIESNHDEAMLVTGRIRCRCSGGSRRAWGISPIATARISCANR